MEECHIRPSPGTKLGHKVTPEAKQATKDWRLKEPQWKLKLYSAGEFFSTRKAL